MPDTSPPTTPPPSTVSTPVAPPPITPERVAELLGELSFLDLCALVLAFSKQTRCQIVWKHPRCSVSIKPAPRVRKSATV